MSKIDPRDGLKYLTNIGMRFLARSKLGKLKDEKGNYFWSSFKLGKLLEEHGYIKLKYTGKGKPYTYFCVKSISQDEIEKLIQLESVHSSDQSKENNSNPSNKEPSTSY